MTTITKPELSECGKAERVQRWGEPIAAIPAELVEMPDYPGHHYTAHRGYEVYAQPSDIGPLWTWKVVRLDWAGSYYQMDISGVAKTGWAASREQCAELGLAEARRRADEDIRWLEERTP